MKANRVNKLDLKILSKVPEETAHIISLVTTSTITEVYLYSTLESLRFLW